ncbi:class I adenylate-forming enzyme family protein [Stella sp.]|uniref:class I adenylate-forming enzyme family protein n=1 Tax=Stella sp. TaxID=2912054 RepID=UPI0035AE9479
MNIVAAFAARAEATPDMPAVVEGDRVVGYGRLGAAVLEAAAAFAGRGWTGGTRVGVCLSGPAALRVATMLALARIGAVQLPLAAGDPPALRAQTMRQFRLTALVTDAGDVPAGVAVVRPDERWLAPRPGPGRAAPPIAAGDEAPWTIVQSSGTTGQRKAFHVSHAMEAARTAAQPHHALPQPGERCLSLIPLESRSGQSAALRCLDGGATLIAQTGPFEPRRIVAAIRGAGISFLIATPAQLTALVEVLPDEGGPWLPGLRFLRANSGAVTPDLLARIGRRMTPNLHVDYGTNEAGTIAIATPDDLGSDPTSVGRPVAGIEVEIVDGADGRGEIRVRGPGVCRGYIDDAAATRLAFRNGWFHPGDLAGRDPEGRLRLYGRRDDRLNFGGIKVSLEEIERVALAHPAVAEAAAFAVPSPRFADVPALAVVAHGGRAVAGLGRHCQDRLGAAAPRHFMLLAALPRTATGKIDRHRLIEMVQARTGGAADARPVSREQ